MICSQVLASAWDLGNVRILPSSTDRNNQVSLVILRWEIMHETIFEFELGAEWVYRRGACMRNHNPHVTSLTFPSLISS